MLPICHHFSLAGSRHPHRGIEVVSRLIIERRVDAAPCNDNPLRLEAGLGWDGTRRDGRASLLDEGGLGLHAILWGQILLGQSLIRVLRRHLIVHIYSQVVACHPCDCALVLDVLHVVGEHLVE